MFRITLCFYRQSEPLSARTKNMMKKILLGILISIGFMTIGFSADQNNFKAVQTELAKTTYLTGHFSQVRNIKLLSSPLKSEGVFIFSKNKGLTWKQTKPFQSTLTITKSHLTQKIGKNPETVFTKKQQPIIFLFTKIFLSAFRGNVTALSPYFKIHFSGNIHHWSMRFVAIHPPINKAIKSIQLVGSRYVNTAIIDEASGDQLTIYFSQMQSERHGV